MLTTELDFNLADYQLESIDVYLAHTNYGVNPKQDYIVREIRHLLNPSY